MRFPTLVRENLHYSPVLCKCQTLRLLPFCSCFHFQTQTISSHALRDQCHAGPRKGTLYVHTKLSLLWCCALLWAPQPLCSPQILSSIPLFSEPARLYSGFSFLHQSLELYVAYLCRHGSPCTCFISNRHEQTLLPHV